MRLHPLMYGFRTYKHTYIHMYMHVYICSFIFMYSVCMGLLGVATKLGIRFVEPSNFQFHSWKSQLLQNDRMMEWAGKHFVYILSSNKASYVLRRSLNWSFKRYVGVTQWKKLFELFVLFQRRLHFELCTCPSVSVLVTECIHMHGYLAFWCIHKFVLDLEKFYRMNMHSALPK